MSCEHDWLVAKVDYPVQRDADLREGFPVVRMDYEAAYLLLVCERCRGFKTFEASRVDEVPPRPKGT